MMAIMRSPSLTRKQITISSQRSGVLTIFAFICLGLVIVSGRGSGWFAVPVLANDEEVIARINGVNITRADYDLAEAELATELATLPVKQRESIIMDYLIESVVMAEAAKAQHLDKTPAYKARIAYYKKRALRDIFFERKIRDAITEADVRRIYDQQIVPQSRKEEVRVRHILVKTKAEAEQILRELKQGKEFGALASARSLGPSRVQGGDLGYFSRGQMVKPFEEAAFALKPGELSGPVKTRYGWHILLLEDKRKSEPPAFDLVRDSIMAPLVQQKAQKIIADLRKHARVEVLDPELKRELAKKPSATAADDIENADDADKTAPATDDAATAHSESQSKADQQAKPPH